MDAPATKGPTDGEEVRLDTTGFARRRRHVAFGLLVALVVAAGSVGLWPASAVSPVSTGAPPVQSTAPDASSTPLASPGPLLIRPAPAPPSEAGGRAALPRQSHTLQLVPMDPDTGAELAGYPPIDVGQHYTLAVSPDGRWLAYSAAPVPDKAGVLNLFDLRDWSTAAVSNASVFVGGLTWNRGGDRIFVYRYPEPGHSGHFDALLAIDARNGDVLARAPFEGDSLSGLGMTSDGSTLFGFTSHPPLLVNGVATGTGHDQHGRVVLLDGTTLREREHLDLSEVVVGSREERTGPGGPPFRVYWPGVAASPDARRYYVAHADADLVTVVDLVKLRARTFNPHRSGSVLERVLEGWLGRRAQAKTNEGVRKKAGVSPDGRWLYVLKTQIEDVRLDEGGVELEFSDGLRVIDTRTMREVTHLRASVNDFHQSPDGRWLYLVTAGDGWLDPAALRRAADRGNAAAARWLATPRRPGLVVVETGTWREVARLQDEHGFWSLVTVDGQRLYLRGPGPDFGRWTAAGEMGPWPYRLTIYDLGRQAVVARRDFSSWFNVIARPSDRAY